MTLSIALALVIHVLSATLWVGGMFFAYICLRPAAGALEPPLRLALWRGVFDLFLPWVWATVLALLATGYFLVYGFYGGFDLAGLPITIMHAVAWLMTILFLVLYSGPYRSLGRALDGQDVPAAAESLNQIRRIISINLPLGLINIAVGASGPFWR
ncbi:MAG: hypothetical protein GY791_06910 [Alphaproteobacteria bacterium]|nr:hypothetical protein [Alphaproteobacteria bacterium]